MEIGNCRSRWQGELAMVRPRLIIPVGRLAIAELIQAKRLEDVVSSCWERRLTGGGAVDAIPLPHPSGVSIWFKRERGKKLLAQALSRIAVHPAWREVIER